MLPQSGRSRSKRWLEGWHNAPLPAWQAESGSDHDPDIVLITVRHFRRNSFSGIEGGMTRSGPNRSRRFFPILASILLSLFAPQSALLATEQELSWTDWADLALASPVVLAVEIEKVDRLGRRAAPDVPPGEVRALVEGNLTAALKAPGLLPGAAAWLWQGPANARGRPPFAPPAHVLVFARPLAGGADPSTQPLALVSRSAQQPWSAANADLIRQLLMEARETGGDRMVTGITDAFHGAGAVEGASESQFFLSTRAGGPMTLMVRRSPVADPEILVADGDLVDRAVPVTPRTLAWRALACGLPESLPERLAADKGLADDYALARARIGACGRTLQPPA